MRYLFFLIFGLVSCSSTPQQLYSFSSSKMGVDFRVDFYDTDHGHAVACAEKVFARIESINQCMSDYIVDSELWQLSAASGTNKPFKVSEDMWKILVDSHRVNKMTNGAFDITVGPYVLLWRQARVTKKFPLEKSLTRAAQSIGMEKVIMNSKDKTVTLTAPDMRLDLGGIAKGYALDEGLKILKENGIKYAMIDGGGDIVMTEKPDGLWAIHISPNIESDGTFVALSNVAIATSGDSFQNVIIDDKKYSHIVDPATGLGVTDSYLVTVIAPDGVTADGLASGLTVLGPEKGIDLIEKLDGIEAMMMKIQNGQKIVFASSGFPKILIKKHMEKK